jgi:hypothetical protein
LKNAIGEDAANAILVQTAMTSSFDVSLTNAIFANPIYQGKKLQVFDRRFNDDTDLRN